MGLIVPNRGRVSRHSYQLKDKDRDVFPDSPILPVYCLILSIP